MSKARLLALIWVLCAAAILPTGLPLNGVKANHCHPTHSQATAAQTAPAAQPKVSRTPRTRNAAALPSRNTSAVKPPQAAAATVSIEEIYSLRLPQAILTLGEAVKAVESGDRKTELVELSKAIDMLVEIREALGKHVQPQLANTRCPIMGSVINAKTIAANLTRDYQGRKIGFCCGGCPTAWDKLNDEQKQAKLTATKS